MLIAAIGIGAGFAPLLLLRFVDDVQRPRYLFGPYLLRGSVDLILAQTRNFGITLGALTLYGVGTSTGNITYNSVLQVTVPDRLRGRVFAFYDGTWQNLPPRQHRNRRNPRRSLRNRRRLLDRRRTRHRRRNTRTHRQPKVRATRRVEHAS